MVSDHGFAPVDARAPPRRVALAQPIHVAPADVGDDRAATAPRSIYVLDAAHRDAIAAALVELGDHVARGSITTSSSASAAIRTRRSRWSPRRPTNSRDKRAGDLVTDYPAPRHPRLAARRSRDGRVVHRVRPGYPAPLARHDRHARLRADVREMVGRRVADRGTSAARHLSTYDLAMAYRDDHDAALARADALDRELTSAQQEIERDEKRIADLERQLREARAKVPKQKPPRPQPAASDTTPSKVRPWMWAVGGSLVVAIIIVVAIWHHQRDRARVANGWDVDAYLGAAFADARGMEADAELQRMYGEYVDSAGFAQLQLAQGHLRYYFRSPHLAAVDAPGPARLGAPKTAKAPTCLIEEEIYKRNTDLTATREISGDPECGYSLPGPLHCTVVEIWKRAIAKGVPSSALARISMRTRAPPVNREWKFEIDDAHIDLTFPDDCGK